MMFAFSRDRARARLPALADSLGRPSPVITICVLARALMLLTPGQRRRRLPGRQLDRGDRARYRLYNPDGDRGSHPAGRSAAARTMITPPASPCLVTDRATH